MKVTITFKGGDGSGHFNHAGRPGKIGGSASTTRGYSKTTQTRQDAISAVRGQLRHVGVDPTTATEFQIELALSEVRPEFQVNASDAQWKLFMQEFKKWQRSQK